MIVNCPNCSLQQPLDPFCAGCGKQLPKLIAEHKRKAKLRNKRTQKIILSSLAVFSFGFYVYYAYQNPSARPFAQTGAKPIKLTMSTGTIKASKYNKKVMSESLKVKSFSVTGTKTKGIKPVPFKGLNTVVKNETPSISLQDFYILDVEPCTAGDVETGALSVDELSFFLDCAKVVLKISNGETTDIDPRLSFPNSVSLDVKENNLNLKFELSLNDPPLIKNSNIKLKQSDGRRAGHISKIVESKSVMTYINDKAPENLKEVLESYAMTRSLQLTSDDKPSPKGYFLAVYE